MRDNQEFKLRDVESHEWWHDEHNFMERTLVTNRHVT